MSVITIRVSSLLHAASQMSNEKCNYVDVSIIESSKDEETGEVYPATMSFAVYDKYGGTEDWEELEIEEVPAPKSY